MARLAADASAFAAIADPTRRAILDTLRDGERSVNEIREALGASPPGCRSRRSASTWPCCGAAGW